MVPARHIHRISSVNCGANDARSVVQLQSRGKSQSSPCGYMTTLHKIGSALSVVTFFPRVAETSPCFHLRSLQSDDSNRCWYRGSPPLLVRRTRSGFHSDPCRRRSPCIFFQCAWPSILCTSSRLFPSVGETHRTPVRAFTVRERFCWDSCFLTAPESVKFPSRLRACNWSIPLYFYCFTSDNEIEQFWSTRRSAYCCLVPDLYSSAMCTDVAGRHCLPPLNGTRCCLLHMTSKYQLCYYKLANFFYRIKSLWWLQLPTTFLCLQSGFSAATF